ncbi:MAG TPA: hypothetical protein VMP00_07860 [Burkholderiales bacterium]|nr:hypothetical protein [Burkholderiales bacterium]
MTAVDNRQSNRSGVAHRAGLIFFRQFNHHKSECSACASGATQAGELAANNAAT